MTGNMTYSLINRFESLLRPDSLYSAEAILHGGIPVPLVPGIYGWWFRDPPAAVPLNGTLKHHSHHLVYVGIAPRRPSRNGSQSASTLYSRIIRNHLGGTIRNSTLRRSLASLLASEIGLDIKRSGKHQSMTRDDETKLNRWIANHAALSFSTHEAPWDAEETLLRSQLPLPLNISGSSHPFRHQLRKLRSGR